MMDKIFNWEQWRMIAVSAISPVLAFLTPTKGFVFALVLMFAFNVWAGMRADGVSVVRCRNFSFKKFKNALAELLLYLVISETIYSIHAYPANKALRIIYHVIRFEFKRALPENVQKIVERVEREHGDTLHEELVEPKNKKENEK